MCCRPFSPNPPTRRDTLLRIQLIACVFATTFLIHTSVARPATQAAQDLGQSHLFAAHEAGAGSDLMIAIAEPGACIDREHEAFQHVQFLPRLPTSSCNPRLSGGWPVFGHATKVASALASVRWGDDYSGLFGGRLFEFDSTHNVWDTVFELHPDFINLSQTTQPKHAFDLDRAVYTHRIFVANGAGNFGFEVEHQARCASYNSLCVGGYLHNGTLGPGQYFDDQLQPLSNWRNAAASGREEPDLVGPGLQAMASAQGGYAQEGGTSYAAPSVIGLAALLTANYPAELRREPTLMRALLMASASHRVVDPETPWFGAPVIGDSIDDRSGAGAPRGDRASAIVEAGRTSARSIARDEDFDADGRMDGTLTISVGEDAIVRVALAWDQCPIPTQNDADLLTVDLDLSVRGPGISIDEFETGISEVIRHPDEASVQNPFIGLGGAVGDTWQERLTHREILVSNISRVDNYELVEFRAPVAGEYRIEVDVERWDVCDYDGQLRTNMALAWDVQGGSQPVRPQFATSTLSMTATGGGPAPVWSPDFGTNQGYQVDVHPRHLADVDGDGRDDVVAFANNGVYVALADGFGFAASERWTTLHAITLPEDDDTYPRHLADVNGDGRADIVQFYQFGTWVSLSTGDGFSFWRRWSESFGTSEGYSTAEHIRLLQDMNDDGLADVVAFANRGVYVALSDGQFFGTVERWTDSFGRDSEGWSVQHHLRMLADVNADGYPDVVGFGRWGVYVGVSTGQGFAPALGWLADFGNSVGGWTVGQHPRFVRDVTGDGLPDIVGIGQQGVRVSVGTGFRFEDSELWLGDFGAATGGWTEGVHPRFVEDVDGDGRADVIGFSNAGVRVAYSTGNDLAPSENVISSFGSVAGWSASSHPRTLADPDGDGVLEVVGFFDDGTRVGQLLPDEVTFVPEPGTAIGLFSGVLLLAGIARRRQAGR